MAHDPDKPLASDPKVCAEIERWLNSEGLAIAYGVCSARTKRGDLNLFSPWYPRSPYRTSIQRA